ncbi:uncharacterized protein LOC143534317 [Bidens hawaiensis]|uniref:uncharacterized protein LOC143534317 n=1 Tax=Bidens hawaiensis TaxID=980011 RepID=UPI00404A29C5
MNKLYAGKPAAALGLSTRRRLFYTKPSNKLGGSTKSLAHGNGKPSNKRNKSTKSPASVLTVEDIIRQLMARGRDLFDNHDLCCHQLYPKPYPESTELDLIKLYDLDFESDVVANEIDGGKDSDASSDDIVTDEEEDLIDPK